MSEEDFSEGSRLPMLHWSLLRDAPWSAVVLVPRGAGGNAKPKTKKGPSRKKKPAR